MGVRGQGAEERVHLQKAAKVCELMPPPNTQTSLLLQSQTNHPYAQSQVEGFLARTGWLVLIPRGIGVVFQVSLLSPTVNVPAVGEQVSSGRADWKNTVGQPRGQVLDMDFWGSSMVKLSPVQGKSAARTRPWIELKFNTYHEPPPSFCSPSSIPISSLSEAVPRI